MNTFRRVSSSSAASTTAAVAAVAFFYMLEVFCSTKFALEIPFQHLEHMGKKTKHTRRFQQSKNLNSASTLDNYLMIEVLDPCHEKYNSSSNTLITFSGAKSKYAWCFAGFSAKV